MKIISENTEGLFVMSEGPQYSRWEASFGWPDPSTNEERKSHHALMVGGVREDGDLFVAEEHIGTLFQVTQKAVNVKDRLWLKRIWVDPQRKDIIVQIRTSEWADGLTRYIEEGKNVRGDRVYLERKPTERWPNFRSHDDTAVLRPVPETVCSDVSSGWARLLSSVESGKVIVHRNCSELLSCLKEKVPSRILDHPVVIATTFLLYALIQVKGISGQKVTTESKGAYGNLLKK